MSDSVFLIFEYPEEEESDWDYYRKHGTWSPKDQQKHIEYHKECEEYDERMIDYGDKLEKATKGRYYIGQDDGKVFMGVPLGEEDILSELFPGYTHFKTNKEDWPLDYDFERDGIDYDG